MKLVPDKKFKKKLMVNPDPQPGEPDLIAEFDMMTVALYEDQMKVFRGRILGFQPEKAITVSFCERISASLTSPRFLTTGALKFFTQHYGHETGDLATPVIKKDMELAETVAYIVEERSREYRATSGRC